MTQLNFDATHVKPNEGFDTIPAGWYRAIIDESEMRPTKDGTGLRLNLRFMVIDGPYTNRKVFCGLNIKNNSEKAVEIAMGQLSAIAHAVGVLQVADSQQLHNLPMWIKVKIQKDESGQYEDKNDITSFKNINDPSVLAAATPPPGTGFYTPPAPAAGAGWAAAAAQPWAQPPAPAAAPAAPAPIPAPAAWTPPGAAPGAQPWQHQPPAQGAPPAPPPGPPHPAQSAPPPWQQPAAPAATSAAVPPWQQPRQ